MNTNHILCVLEQEWDFDDGFLGRLRYGEFEVASLHRLLAVLETFSLNDSEDINRRLVSLLWYMPLFMEWQKERVQEEGGDRLALQNAINQVQTHVERLLGVP